jgi:hypothetical protein
MSPSIDRNTVLTSVVTAYFDGLRSRDLTRVPWSDSVKLRAPLAEGGSENPLVGRAAVEAYFTPILPAIADVRLVDVYVNQSMTAAMGKADLTLANGKRLRVADLFEVDDNGLIVAQENHYDPRPAM